MHLLKGLETLGNGMYTGPADHGHEKLKKSKCSGNAEHPFPAHSRILQSVGHRDGKGIHSQSHTENYTFQDEIQRNLHVFSIPERSVRGAAGIPHFKAPSYMDFEVYTFSSVVRNAVMLVSTNLY